MATIEYIKEEWKKDSVINQSKLNDEIVRNAMNHSKYIDYFVEFRAKQIQMQKKINLLKNLKRRYYRGELDQRELKEYGWEQWQGLKPAANELRDLFDQDVDLNELVEKQAYFETALTVIEYIVKSINGREYSMRTLFDLRKFEAGG